MANSIKFGTKDITRFIEIYRSHVCLWDARHPDYKSRDVRHAALSSFESELAIDGFRVADIKNKIKNIRSQYLQERKKIRESVGSDSVYRSKLHWFDLLDSFLPCAGNADSESRTTSVKLTSQPMPSACHTDAGIAISGDANSSHHQLQLQADAADDVTVKSEELVVAPDIAYSYDDSHSEDADEDVATSEDYPPRKRPKLRPKLQQPQLEKRSEPCCVQVENEWDIFGRHVAAQLKLLSPVQALTAHMEINNIITKCRFSDLYNQSTSRDSPLRVSSTSMSKTHKEEPHSPSNNSSLL